MIEKKDSPLQKKIEQLRAEIIKRTEPKEIAIRCGWEFIDNPGNSNFRFQVFNNSVRMSYPDLVAYDCHDGTKMNSGIQGLLCYHMATSDGHPLTGTWVSFAELPNGRFYNVAFQGYSGDNLSAAIRGEVHLLEHAACRLHGSAMNIGDISFKFSALTRVPIAIVYWVGDDEFPHSCKILFDSSISHHLPTDTCAILGSILTQKILAYISE
jgi:hypothetical protein